TLVKAMQDASKDVNKALPNPFDPGSFEHLLKLVAGSLHDKGVYVGDTGKFPEPAEHLQVSGAWVLLARPRATNFLHEDIERLKKRIAQGITIPVGPAALVTPASTEPVAYEGVQFRGLSGYSGGSSAGSGSKAGVRELYFPLPYNREQVTIVEQLE